MKLVWSEHAAHVLQWRVAVHDRRFFSFLRGREPAGGGGETSCAEPGQMIISCTCITWHVQEQGDGFGRGLVGLQLSSTIAEAVSR